MPLYNLHYCSYYTLTRQQNYSLNSIATFAKTYLVIEISIHFDDLGESRSSTSSAAAAFAVATAGSSNPRDYSFPIRGIPGSSRSQTCIQLPSSFTPLAAVTETRGCGNISTGHLLTLPVPNFSTPNISLLLFLLFIIINCIMFDYHLFFIYQLLFHFI